MELSEYQNRAAATAIFPKEVGLIYCTLGLVGEAGEVANKIKKVYRDNADPHAAAAELGDVLWYLAALATELGLNLDNIADSNLTKLELRKARGTLQGNGDHR